MVYSNENLVEFLRSIVKTPSLSGQENLVVDVISKKMKEMNYDEIYTDKYGNLIGGIFGKRPGKTIVMDGHIDTVDISDINRWTHDPYAAEIVGSKIYGRGTSDMKGGVACMVTAAAHFAQQCNKDFAGKIYVSCSVHEECFEGVAPRLVADYCKPDWVIIGEATNLTLKRGQRGRAEIKVETIGKTCHSSNPEKGINAVNNMVKLLNIISEVKAPEHPLLGKGIMELTDIVSSPYPGSSVVPGLCTVTFDKRLLPEETPESILKPFEEAIERLKKEDSTFKARCYISEGEQKCWTGNDIKAQRFFPAWVLEEDHELVQKAFMGIKSQGIETKMSHYSFCTNGSSYCGEKHIPTIGFGPSLENLAHTIDEYVETDQLIQAEKGYVGILTQLMN